MGNKKKLIIASLLGCAGCSTTGAPPPGIEVRTVEVLKPVSVPCIAKGDVPAEPPMVGNKLNGQAAHDADVIGASAVLLRQWGRELRALIMPCTKP